MYVKYCIQSQKWYVLKTVINPWIKSYYYTCIQQTLVAFEYLWYQAWVQSIDQAKAGLQATLIVRHPDDGKLYVNFDQEILQLIRESKCLGMYVGQIKCSFLLLP